MQCKQIETTQLNNNEVVFKSGVCGDIRFFLDGTLSYEWEESCLECKFKKTVGLAHMKAYNRCQGFITPVPLPPFLSRLRLVANYEAIVSI